MKSKSLPAQAKQLSDDEILEAIQGSARSLRFSPVFFLASLVVAAAMVTLPIVYLGLIAAVCYALYYHAINDVWMMEFGRGARVRFVLYSVPFLVGIILVFFMLKPLLARRRFRDTGLRIERNQEPLLFDFVDRLCKAMGAPRPSQIRLDCDVNASASLGKGLLGFFANRLVLTIGMPIVACLPLTQFAGVLAHEFGHFTQRLSMRLSYIIRSVNNWFAFVVYGRDTWDEQLDEGINAGGLWSLVLLFAKLAIWLTRRVLWLLMHIGHALSCALLRQMEYGADQCEARIAGSMAASASQSSGRIMNYANRSAHADLKEGWKSRRLVDNLPALVANHFTAVSQEVLNEIAEDRKKERTGLFDTHPCDRERLERFNSLAAPGIIGLDAPAKVLFKNYEAICKAVTLRYYRENIDSSVRADNLVPTAKLIAEHQTVRQNAETIESYFGHELCPARPLLVTMDDVPKSSPPETVKAKLLQTRTALNRAMEKVHAAYVQYTKAKHALIEAAQASALCRAEVRFNPSAYHIEKGTEEYIASKRRIAEADRVQAMRVLEVYEKAARQRIGFATALALADGNPGSPSLAAASTQRELKRILTVFANLRVLFDRWHDLFEPYAVLRASLVSYQENVGNPILESAIEASAVKLLDVIREAREAVSDIPYPFEHARGSISTAEYLLESVPPDCAPVAAVEAAATFYDNLVSLYLRSISRLAALLTQVEFKAGLGSEAGPISATNRAQTSS